MAARSRRSRTSLPPKPATTLRQSRRARSLAEARTCYDHLAGRSAVALHDSLVAREWLVPEPGGYRLTDAGRDGLLAWGVDVAAADQSRRAYARPCLDWTERREHLAGALAAAIAAASWTGPSRGSYGVPTTTVACGPPVSG